MDGEFDDFDDDAAAAAAVDDDMALIAVVVGSSRADCTKKDDFGSFGNFGYFVDFADFDSAVQRFDAALNRFVCDQTSKIYHVVVVVCFSLAFD